MVSGGIAAASRRTCKEPGRACSRSVSDCSRITDNNFSTATVLSLLIQVIAQGPDPGLRALQGWGGITGEHT